MDMEKTFKNITAERITIGTLLNHPEWLIELNGIVKTDYFFMLGHKTIFHIIVTLLHEGVEHIDSMAILARAERIARATEVLNENGGLEYLEELKELSEEYSVQELKGYASEVTSCSYKREQLKLNEEIVKSMYSHPEWSPSQLEIFIQDKQQELASKYSSGSQLAFIQDVFNEAWSEIEENRTGDGIVGLPSKFPMVNKYFTYMNGELIVIGARAKYGKSNFAINEAHNLAVLRGIPVAIFDTEMKTRTFLLRILSIDSRVPIREIASGEYLKDINKVMAVEASKARIKKAPILHKYDHAWDKSKIAHNAKLLKLRYNLGLLIYDYIKVKEVGGNVKEHSELGNMTIFLKDLAGELDIPILTFGQLSPFERRLADSDKINRYASTIAYLLPKSNEEIQRDFGAKEGGRDMLFVDYNRNGASMSEGDPTKGINFIYDRDIATMIQAPYQSLTGDFE